MKPLDTFQNRLDKAMKIKNIRQVELHEKTGISESLLSKYLSGDAIARQKKLTLLADALNINEVWLLGYDVSMDRNLNQEKNNQNILDIDGLDENDIEEIKALIEFKKNKKQKR